MLLFKKQNELFDKSIDNLISNYNMYGRYRNVNDKSLNNQFNKFSTSETIFSSKFEYFLMWVSMNFFEKVEKLLDNVELSEVKHRWGIGVLSILKYLFNSDGLLLINLTNCRKIIYGYTNFCRKNFLTILIFFSYFFLSWIILVVMCLLHESIHLLEDFLSNDSELI